MKKACWSILSLLMVMCLFVGTLLAADTVPAADSVSANSAALVSCLQQTVFPFLGALVIGFVSWAAKKAGNKFHIESLAADNNFLTQLASQAVAFAEERAANFAKASKPISSNEKLNSAIAYILQMSPKVSEAQAQSLVTSALAMLPGVGATGPAAVSAAPVIPSIPAATSAPAASTDPLAVHP